MTTIEIISIKHGERHVEGELRSTAAGGVEFGGVPPGLVAFLRNFGAVAEDGTVYEWTDGERWLRALPRSLAGTYLWAKRH
jgi:hypothetical protein